MLPFRGSSFQIVQRLYDFSGRVLLQANVDAPYLRESEIERQLLPVYLRTLSQRFLVTQ